tara:strand:+ start:166 stop:984 length:819 start_codon:yes stop_codon:yes gene_type:complete
MSVKTFIQVLILSLIILIIGGVYFKYFETKKNIVEEVNLSNLKNSEQLEKLEAKISELEFKNEQLSEKIKNNKNKSVEITSETVERAKQIKENKDSSLEKIKSENVKIKNKDQKEKSENKIIKKKKKDIKNLVKDVEYSSVDQKGNRFNLLANSGKSNADNNNILDLENVRGEIKSDKRDNIYIVSDFAQYNTSNLNSKFYENVIIEYQDKKITCGNFDINMKTNKAIAYNNVKITDPQSIMKAGIVEFDLATKDVNINPENTTTNIEVITN